MGFCLLTPLPAAGFGAIHFECSLTAVPEFLLAEENKATAATCQTVI